MGVAEKKKRAFAEQLKWQMGITPMRQITVSKLCSDLSVNRRTFYNHFRSIDDLVAWIYDRTRADCTLAGLTETLSAIRRDADFYRRALSEGALGEHIVARTAADYESALRERGAWSEDDRFAVRYHCAGYLGALRRWLDADCKPTPQALAKQLIAVMPPCLQSLYE